MPCAHRRQANQEQANQEQAKQALTPVIIIQLVQCLVSLKYQAGEIPMLYNLFFKAEIIQI